MGANETTYGKQLALECGSDLHLGITSHVDKHTLAMEDGTLIRIIEVGGLAYDTTSDEDISNWQITRNVWLQSIQQPRLGVWSHLIREKEANYPTGECNSDFSKHLDESYKKSIEADNQYNNRLYISLVLKAPIGSKFLNKLGSFSDALQKRFQELNEITQTTLESLSRYSPRLLSTYEHKNNMYSEPLEFIGRILNGAFQRVPLTIHKANKVVLNVQLQFGKDTFLQRGIDEHRYGGMLSLKTYSNETAPGMLDALMEAPAEMVLTQSFIFFSKTAATETLQRQQAKMLSAGDLAESQIVEIDEALDQLTSNKFTLGRHHLTLSTTANTKEAVEKNLALCQGILMDASSIISGRERLGLEAAFWAQIPGNSSYIVRGAPITSRNFASFVSFHNTPSGKQNGNHWGPAVALFRSPSQTPYYFNFHHPKDLGNTTIIGPSGTGKTVLVLFLLAQLEKLNVTRVYFDKDRGAEIALRAMGGNYTTLQEGICTGLNPCQLPDNAANRGFLGRWLSVLGRGAAAQTSAETEEIQRAVEGNYALPLEQRRLSTLLAYFQTGGLRERLGQWIEGSTYGWVFDNAKDSLELDNDLIGFDVTEFLGNSAIRTPVMLYLFHRIEGLLDGRRMCLSFDEGWRLLDDPIFADTLKDWLKVIRKKNGFTIFATQEPGDVLQSSVASTIRSQSPTQLFLPNPKAEKTDYVDGFGLTEKEYQVIRNLAENSRQFLIKQGLYSSIVSFNLLGMDDVIAVLSGTTANIELLDGLRAEVGDDPKAWLPLFYSRR